MEFDHRESEDVKYISDKIWKCFNILRAAIPTEHFHVVLFFLSTYNDDIIDGHSPNKDNIINRLKNSLNNDGYYSRIFRIYEPIIRNIKNEYFEEFFHRLGQIDRYVLSANFELIFENLLYRLGESQGKRSGEFLLPIEITKLVMELAAVPSYAKIYNPFAGLASFGSSLDSGQEYFAQELNEITWALGMLRLLSNRNLRQNYLRNIEYQLEDSIKNWPSQNHYDLIVSNPPFGLKVKNDNYYQSSGLRNFTSEQYLLERGLESINFDGKVIAVLSEGFLFREGNEYELRKRLVEQDKIDTIISLPIGLLSHTAIPTCIIILRHNTQNYRKIRMVNSKDFILSKNGKSNKLDLETLLYILKEDSDPEFVRLVPAEEVRESNYNLSVQRYFAKNFSGVPLKEIIEPIQSGRTQRGNLGRLVKIRNLKDDSQDHFLNWKQIEIKELPGHTSLIAESCILLALRFKTLKATYFEFQGEPIYLPPYILAIKVNSNFVDQHYLINEMYSEYVLEQIAAFRVSGITPILKRNDLLNIKIELPSIEEQRGKVKGLRELSKKLDNLENERNALLHGKSLSQFDEFASLKHSIGAPRQNILSNAKSLIRFFEKNDSKAFVEVKNQFRNHYNVDLLRTFEEIRDDINHISTILERGEGGLILTNYQSSIISIEKVNEMIKNYPDAGLNFKIDYQPLSKVEMSKKGISSNLTLFKILFDNIISNAQKYAFSEKSDTNEVSIEIKVSDDFMELTLKNNGKPFPVNFDKDKFTRKYTTLNNQKGTGLGGYDINRIASHFGNPDWDLILDENDIYPVTFKFNFSIIPLINE
tara:strand:+ start:1375 stop:3825 length:2451 start_codon:yes stop_codon:yes gene_type:complete